MDGQDVNMHMQLTLSRLNCSESCSRASSTMVFARPMAAAHIVCWQRSHFLLATMNTQQALIPKVAQQYLGFV